MDKKTPLLVDLNNARLDEQRAVMQEIIAADHCPFCRENLAKYHKPPILREGEYWLVTTNQWPYAHTRLHLLFILQEHATDLTELPAAAGTELLEHAQWAAREYAISGGGLVMRFGDTAHSAGTVAHLHAQLVVPQLSDDDFEPVRITIGKKREEHHGS